VIDIGVNLLNPQFEADREAVVRRAAEAGITDMILTGTDIAVSRAARDYCAAHGSAPPGRHSTPPAGRPTTRLFATAGIHPHEAKDAPPDWEAEIEALAATPEVVAIGETGLDFNRNFSPADLQADCFRRQIGLARELDMPVFVHDREASAAVLETFRAVFGQGTQAASSTVVHCFTGTADALHAYLALGCHIGITGWVCDRRRGAELRALVGQIPLDRLLVETDAPFLRPQNAPADQHGRRNEPALLTHVIERLAECRGESAETIAAQAAANARRLFRLPGP